MRARKWPASFARNASGRSLAPAFLDEYKAALERLNAGIVGATGVTIKVGALGWLVAEHEQSFAFLKLAKREQRVRHLMLESCLNEATKPGSPYKFRNCPLAEFTPDHVRLMRDPKKGGARRREQPSEVASRYVQLGLRRAVHMGQDQSSGGGQGARLRKEDVP